MKFVTPYSTEVYYITNENEKVKNEDFENAENKERFLFVYEDDFREKIRKLIIKCNSSIVPDKKYVINIYENKEYKVFEKDDNVF